MTVAVDRVAPTREAAELFALVRDLADKVVAPRADQMEAASEFPREIFRTIGQAGLLGLPYEERYGGGAQPYEVYLQVVEELARAWLCVGLGVSVHTLACYPVSQYGTEEQRERWLADMVGGDQLGAYCLSEPASGSDAAALTTRAVADGDDYVINGAKSWVSHGGVADFYNVLARTGGEGAHGISCVLTPASTPGLTPARPEHKMGMRSSVTAQIAFDGARVPQANLIGAEGEGFAIAMSALDGGRLGIAACAVGLAQAAFDVALPYASEREQFGKPIINFEGVSFMLADMATGIEAARALYLAAARRRDAGKPYRRQAAMSKLFASDVAMRVTTDAVQVLGGYGYVEDYRVERFMREAKVLQIVEGTNEIQRLVIGRTLADDARR